MARKHNVFMDAVSEMKHFLLGAALVLVLVTVVPALAQEGPGGPPPGGNMPPPMNQGGGMPPPQQGGQPQGGQQFGGQPQGGQQFGGQPQGGQQFGGQPQGGQQNGQFGQPSGQQPGNMQFGQGMNGKMGEQNMGEFKCFSDLSAKTPAECDAADDKAGLKKGEKFEKGDMKGSPMSPANEPSNKGPMNSFEGKEKGSSKFDVPTAPSKFDFPTSTPTTKSKPTSKFAPEFKLDLTEFEDESIVDGEAVFESVLGQFEGKKLSSKAAKVAAKSVAKFLDGQSELLCAAIEDEDDASDCVDAFEKLGAKIGKAKDSKSLLKAITKLRDAYYDLAGFDIPDEE